MTRAVLLSLSCFAVGCTQQVELVLGDPDAAVSLDAPVADSLCPRGAVGAPCVADGECCSGVCQLGGCVATRTCRGSGACGDATSCCSGSCAAPVIGVPGCRPNQGCAPVGAPCVEPGVCCSLGCAVDGKRGGGATCAVGAICAARGAPCTQAIDCCSGACVQLRCAVPAMACLTAGEDCVDPMTCCGLACTAGGDGKRRCLLLRGCRVAGELCVAGSDCCGGRCAPDALGVNRCLKLAKCGPAGELCTDANSCCGRSCALDPDGMKRCNYLGGCRVAGELCAAEGDCCTGSCAFTSDGVERCQPPMKNPCFPDGELCGGNGDCCPSPGPPGSCFADPPMGAPKRCHPVGDAAACRGDGAPCALPSECCGNSCLPSGGGLRCGSGCVALGGGCTVDGDCCAGLGCQPVNGHATCVPLIQ